jgi:aryl-alcohol dehydrogenase-like predicted oxidoreductase
MNYKLFGNSGLRVSEIALGTMTFGEEWGWGCDYKTSKEIFDIYANAGGNFIDTANLYTEGTSERFCGDFISQDRDYFVLATKYTLREFQGNPNGSGNNRKNLRQSVERSLQRLNTDYIDLLWVHAWDYTTPVEEVMRGLDDLVRSGKVLYIAISDTPAWVVSRANMYARERGLTEFSGLQIEYSLIERTVERELIPMAKELGLSVTPWAALGGGLLTGKYLNKDSQPKRMEEDNPRMTEKNFAIARKVVEVAEKVGASPAQVALKWVIHQHKSMIPIIGARKASQLEDSLGALNLTLSDDNIKELNDVSAIDLGFPHRFLENERIRDIVYAGTYDKIEFR